MRAREAVVRQVEDVGRDGHEGAVVDGGQVVPAEVGRHDARRLREQEGAQALQVVVVGAEVPGGYREGGQVESRWNEGRNE